MRLERVIAKDSRRATEQVIEQFGADALIISNQKVNGMTEIVVAVDIDADPLASPPINRIVSSDPGDPVGGPSVTRSRIRSERSEPLLQSIPPTPPDREPAFETYPSNHFGMALHQSLKGQDAREPIIEPGAHESRPAARPVISHAPRATIPEWLSSRTPAPVRPVDSEIAPRHEDASADSVDESIRARELVAMVRDELASMRREMNLSRQLVLQSSGRRLAPDVQAIADALEQSGAPVALRSLLLDQIAECADAPQATEAIRKALVGSIRVAPGRGRFEGLHVIAGPSGSGKTQMAFRLASRHAAVRGAPSVALISFADQRIGAWTQLQMLAARLGIDCYRVADASLLGALLGELSSRELIVIDTAAHAWKSELSAIAESAPRAHFHLVLPGDASLSAVQRFNASRAWSWASLMISKLDESPQPWPVIQALCNQTFSLSLGSFDPGPDALPREIDPVELVSGALASLLQVSETSAPVPTRLRRSTARKTPKEMRNAA